MISKNVPPFQKLLLGAICDNYPPPKFGPVRGEALNILKDTKKI